jgi:hypothetical protein
MTVLAVLFALIAIPQEAFAWGAGIHLQLGTAVLANLDLIRPAVAAVIGAYPHDFLYGCMAADITIGKKFTHYLLHCHRWNMGMKILRESGPEPQQACAYGYLSHLAADTVAHNYYVPMKTMESFSSLTLKHAYWEMRFETLVDREIWATGNMVAKEHFEANDRMLRRVLSDTLFSFGTNKRIFNSILLVSRLEKWQHVLQTINDTSRFPLEEAEKVEFLSLAHEAVFDILKNGEDGRFFRADPTGERALATAEAVRKNLRLLYRSNKISKEQALEQLGEMQGKMRSAICEPELLLQVLSG